MRPQGRPKREHRAASPPAVPASATALLSVRDVVIRYGGIAAVQGLSLQIESGEIVMLTGPNGAGKSSLLCAIAGLVKPSSGRIILNGEDVSGRSPEGIARRGFSMVPEGRHVFGSLTVLENLKVAVGMRADKAAAQADLEHAMEVFPLLRQFAHSQAGMLSGGQQQMLVIARGLMTSPRLLAIDEPSLGLAPKVTDQVYEALLQVRQQRDLTLLIVEQSASRAQRVGARMVMLREGRVVLQGNPRAMTAAQLENAYFGYEEQAATP